MALCSAPRRPSGSRISGFQRVGQAVPNRGYERTPGVLAGEVLALAFEEIPVQSKDLVVTLNTNRPDIHGGSLPYRDAGSVRIPRTRSSHRLRQPAGAGWLRQRLAGQHSTHLTL